jgi:hypothetical protein
MPGGDRVAIGVLTLLGLVGAAAVAAPFLFTFLWQWGLSQQARDNLPECHEVDPDVIARIEGSLTIPGGGSLRGARLEMSEVNPQLGVISADVQGAGYEGDHNIGIWLIREESVPLTRTFEESDPISAVNGLAAQVSNFASSGQYYYTRC